MLRLRVPTVNRIYYSIIKKVQTLHENTKKNFQLVLQRDTKKGKEHKGIQM